MLGSQGHSTADAIHHIELNSLDGDTIRRAKDRAGEAARDMEYGSGWS
jgi:hypothetical protein